MSLATVTCSAGVNFVGSVRSLASWSKIARMMIQALRNEGIPVTIREIVGDRWDPTVQLDDNTSGSQSGSVTLTFEVPTDYDLVFANTGRLNVGLLVWEADRWPSAWIAAARSHVHLALVPSAWCRQTLIESGFPGERVRILPHGFDPAVYHSVRSAAAPKRQVMRILYVGTPARRKGLDLLIASVRQAFVPGDQIQFIVKSSVYPDAEARGYLISDWQVQLRELSQAGYAVDVVTENLSEQAMGDLYRSADLIVQPFRGEGFCLPLLEAAACGVPFVATKFGGPLAFLDESFGWFLSPAHLVDAAPLLAHGGYGLQGAVMPEIETDQLAKLLRAIFRDDAGRAMKARLAPSRVAHLTWSCVARQFAETTNQFLARGMGMPT